MGERELTTVASGFLLPEGPRWHDGALWFVDMLRKKVHRLEGTAVDLVATFDRPSSLGFLPNGDMLVVEQNTATLHTVRAGAVVNSLDLSSWGSVNDMAVDRQGNAYIGGGQRRAVSSGSVDGHRWERTGHVVFVPLDGEPRVVAKDLLSPNGVALSGDGKTLVVGESFGRDGTPNNVLLMGYDVAEDGSLSNDRIFGTIDRGCGDGLCFDSEGAVWVGTAFGHDVRRYREGELLDQIPVPDRKWPLAVALGGADLRTLYICNAAAPPKGDPSKFTEAWVETVRVDVPGVRS